MKRCVRRSKVWRRDCGRGVGGRVFAGDALGKAPLLRKSVRRGTCVLLRTGRAGGPSPQREGVRDGLLMAVLLVLDLCGFMLREEIGKFGSKEGGRSEGRLDPEPRSGWQKSAGLNAVRYAFIFALVLMLGLVFGPLRPAGYSTDVRTGRSKKELQSRKVYREWSGDAV